MINKAHSYVDCLLFKLIYSHRIFCVKKMQPRHLKADQPPPPGDLSDQLQLQRLNAAVGIIPLFHLLALCWLSPIFALGWACGEQRKYFSAPKI